MKSVRVVLAVVALLALPFGAVAAQGRAKPKPRTASEVSGECKDQQAATLSRANDAGHDPYGLDKKCPDAPPSGGGGGGGGGQNLPPTGTNHVDGLVYEELDGNSGYNPFAGDMPIANVPVQLSWNGQVIASAVSDAGGAFSFPGLGGTAVNPATFVVCVVSGPSGFSQVVPDPSAPGAPCSGAGYLVIFNNFIETGFPAQFGYLMQ